MHDSSDLQKAREEAAINYFRLVDAADPAVLDLFTDDARMFRSSDSPPGRTRSGRSRKVSAGEFPRSNTTSPVSPFCRPDIMW